MKFWQSATAPKSRPFTLIISALTMLLGQTALAQNSTQVYDQVFSSYAELCTTSQYSEKENPAANGGPYGHAVVYLKGACKVKGAGLPQIELCENGPGVGISTYFAFKNVLWVATEGRDFFFHGEHPRNKPLTKATVEKAIQRAQQLQILEGVQMHDWIMNGRKDPETPEHYMYRMSLGTDWALTYARNLHCVKIPMNTRAMSKMVTYLNNENRKHFSGQPYVYDVASNNCAHTAHNAMAASGAWEPKRTNISKVQILTGLLKDLAIPYNVVMDAADEAYEGVPSISRVKLSGARIEAMKTTNWMLPQAGTILVSYPIHENNQYFNTNSPLAALDFHANGIASQDQVMRDMENMQTRVAKFEAMQKDPRFTDLRTNLEWNYQNFNSTLADYRDGILPTERKLVAAYRQYLRDQATAAARGLHILNQTPAR